MKLPSKATDKRVNFAIRMTPLIDVVFLLMIFFILTIRFIKEDTVLENRLPSQQQHGITDTKKDWEVVHLALSYDQGGTGLTIHLQERVVRTYDELLANLKKLPRDIMLVIEPEARVPYKCVIGVYNTCVKAKKTQIVFAVSPA